MTRTYAASRTILASPRAIFRALIDPEAMSSWRAPEGMGLRVLLFEARVGGHFRLAFDRVEASSTQGEATEDCDVVDGRFLELLPDWSIVEAITVFSGDPALAGEMIVTTTLAPVADGTKVTIAAEQIPAGVREDDHRAGMEATLRNLARFIE